MGKTRCDVCGAREALAFVRRILSRARVVAAALLVTVAAAVLGGAPTAQAGTDYPPDAITIEIGGLDVPIGDNLEFTVANCPEGEPVNATFNDESQTDPCADRKADFSFRSPAECGIYPLLVTAGDQSVSADIAVVDNPAQGRLCPSGPVDPPGPDPDDGLPGAGASNTISMIRIGIGLVVTGAVMVAVVTARRRRVRPI